MEGLEVEEAGVGEMSGSVDDCMKRYMRMELGAESGLNIQRTGKEIVDVHRSVLSKVRSVTTSLPLNP